MSDHDGTSGGASVGAPGVATGREPNEPTGSPGRAGPGSDPAEAPAAVRTRHAADAARIVVAVAALAFLIGVGTAFPEGSRSTTVDLVRLFDHLPRIVLQVLVGGLQILAVAAPLVLVGVLVARRSWEPLATAAGAATAAAVVVAALGRALDDYVPKVVLDRQEAGSWVAGAAFPSAAYLAGAAAVTVVVGSVLGARWRRALWWLVAVFALSRVVTATQVPINAGIALCLGVIVASGVLLAVGRASVPLSTAAVIDLLERHGIPARLRRVECGHRRSEVLEGTDAAGEPLFAKVFDTDDRDRAFLLRSWQRLRVRGIDDRVRLRGARAGAERAALATVLAGRSAVRTPDVLAVVTGGPELAVLVQRPLAGRRLCDVDPAGVTDAALTDLWEQVGRLQRRGIAHRWLDATHVLLDDDGRVGVSDFRWAETDADERQLAADVATLLASTALIVGPARAVDAAVTALGAEAVAATAPLLQPLALSPTVRATAKEQPTLLADVRDEVARRAGVEGVELARLARVGSREVFALLGLVLVAYLVISLASNASDIGQAIGDAEWGRIPLLVAIMFLGQFLGAVTLQGSTPADLPLARTTQLMLAQGFLNRFTPANAGGMALRARFLQRRGEDLTSAAASVGLTSLASGAVQVVFIVGFGLWAGRSGGLPHLSMPSSTTVLVVVLAVLIAAGVVFFTAWGRRLVLERVREMGRSLLRTLSEIAHSPARITQLFGGAALSKLTLILMFSQSCRALGIDVSFPQLGILYMGANTVASAAPTPGGVGAIEAALVAALVGVDVPTATALSAVLLFRVVSYWLPVPFGWWALGDLRRADLV